MPDGIDDDMKEFVNEFLLESYEGLQRLDEDLLVLERDPRNSDAIASLFRTVHTIKGTCGFLGFEKLGALAHQAESLLGALRDGVLLLNSEIASALLAGGDAIRKMLASIESTSTEGDDDFAQLKQRLGALRSGAAKPSSPAAPPAPADGAEDTDDEVPADAPVDTPVVEPAASVPSTDPPPEPQGSSEPVPERPSRRAPKEPGDPRRGTHKAAGVSESTVRIDVALLDTLMTLVGELVLTRNQIHERVAATHDQELMTMVQRVTHVTYDLQDRVMKTRTQPISTVWGKLPRVARDLAMSLGKRVKVTMDGEDTELDRSVMEAVRDPITHLVRNAVDHGIESPAGREAAGKPPEGMVSVTAYHQGGQVILEIGDDGRGIDVAKVKERALTKRIITPAQARDMSDADAVNLIFVAGLSTADQITDVSGRGVGADVVRTRIEEIGGSVEVVNLPGEGTTFRMRIPLTLAIIPALVVGVGGQRFSIPQVNLIELVRVADGTNGIEDLNGAPVFRLRGKLLPLAFLGEVLRLAGYEAETRGASSGSIIVILQVGDQRFGLVVDEVSDSVEIVVKPLSEQLMEIGVFAGATILGDGALSLILDVAGLANRSGIAVSVVERGHRESPDEEVVGAASVGVTPWLVVEASDGERMAVDLGLIDRLEEFASEDVERSGGREVVQYWDEILPLVHVEALLGRPIPDRSTSLGWPVLVRRLEGRPVGIVVDRIIDVVERHLELDPSETPGVAGSAIVADRVTEVLDLRRLLEADGLAGSIGVGS